MSFRDFLGSAPAVRQLRAMLGRDRLPHAIILSGPEGGGKYTLAQMMAKAMNCETRPATDGFPDFCGTCPTCLRIAGADDLDARLAEAEEARENLRDADRRDTRLMVQTHPDVLILPPDPPQKMIKVDQVRRVTETIYYRPGTARRRVYIFTSSAFMKEAANALLKVLEEAPEYATLFLLATNAGELLPTVRSRAMTFSLSPLSATAIEHLLAQRHPEWGAKQRGLVARLSGGAAGRAIGFQLAEYTAARSDALTLLAAGRGNDHSALFQATEAYRSGAEGRARTERLLRALYGLLEDLLYIKTGVPDMARNTDITAELRRLAESVDFAWLEAAARHAGEVESGMRRNLLRSLSLDAFATALER